jgi:hypothetical protein|tara:strand:- start:1147 stop:1959 length:813 start_codon:yes stop_codon:yes gene_type:complete
MENGSISDAGLVDWAIEEVLNTIGGSALVRVEPKLELAGRYFGFADLVSGEHVFDLKSGGVLPSPGYRAQLAGYALAYMEESFRDYCVCHELYIDAKYHRTYRLTWAEAKAIVDGILDAHLDKSSEPTACSYCKWCKHNLTCKALTEDIDDEDMKDFDLSNPKELGEALHAARRFKVWCEAVEKEAKRQLQEGVEVDGWRLQNRKGREAVSILDAHRELYGRMGSDKFLACCSINISKLRKVWGESYNEDLPVEDFIKRSKDTVAMVENK